MGLPNAIRAVRTSEEVIRELEKRDGLAVERIASGTNLFRLRVNAVIQRCSATPGSPRRAANRRGAFLIGVNETLNRMSSAELSTRSREGWREDSARSGFLSGP
jgi:hypothetical protein